MRLPIKFFLLAFIPLLALAQVPQLPGDMHTWAAASIDMVFREDFRNAEEEAKKIIKKYPDHPSGYFFQAAVLDAWMLRHQSRRRETEFFRLCDQAVERAEKILAKDRDDEWARFFMGGAEGYKGTYEARYDRFVTAFRHGWKGVSIFQNMASSGSRIPDIQFGIGTYDYWRSALMKMLWWMPGVSDNRSVGIAKLKEVMENGIYSRAAAAMVLIDIYLNECAFADALELANEMIKKFPRASVFRWGQAAAFQGLEMHEDAIKAYQFLLSRNEIDPSSNHYNSVISRVGMARSMVATGKFDSALEHLAAVNRYDLSKDIRKRLDKAFSEANSLRRQAESRAGK
ncbi:MAG: tetratricopeptide repeat protein [Chitinispirillales bacterium]|jgi:tetratricopeptide (TPR) repeat protein|nr:tetratricopeptide repeat protein [Chitinispirillales bacterium]